ncbi:MAG: hypothetical protein OXC98_12505 [bacterium]|nr:hypothetical protein [Acidimicrobiia bacterium]MCY4651168.1 hypothetical protein [bacterium]
MNRKQWQLPSRAPAGNTSVIAPRKTMRQALEVTFLGLYGIIAPSVDGRVPA